MLPPVLRTEPSAGEHQHERIVPLQLRELAARGAVVRQLVVGEDGPGNDVRSQRGTLSMWRPKLSMWSPASLTASSGVRPCSRATM